MEGQDRNALLLRLGDELQAGGGISDELLAELTGAWPREELGRLLDAAGVERDSWEPRLNGSEPETEPAAPRTHPRADMPVVVRRTVAPRTVLLVASLGVFMAFVDATIVNIAFPDIQRSFAGAGLAELSWVLNAYNIVFAAFLVAAGRAADLLGRKRMFELGLLGFTFASVLCAIAPSPELLVAARVLQAIGAAVVVPASLALVVQAFPASERTRAVALWAAMAALAAGIGPSLGGIVVDVADWRAAFLLNLPVGVAALVLSKRTLVESRAPGQRKMPDLPGAVLFAVAVALLALAIVKSEDWGFGDARVLVSAALAVVLGVWFVQRTRRHPSPVFDLALFRIRSFSAANGLMVLASGAYFALVLNNVLFLTTVWGYSVLEAGLALTPGPFIAAAVAGPAGRYAERLDPRPVIAAGAIFWGAGAALYAFYVGTEPDFLAEWLPVTVVAGIGGGITFPTLSGAAVASAPGGRFATATALNSVARQLGAAFGVALLVAVVGTPAPAEAADAFDRGWLLALGCFVLLLVATPVIGRVAPATDDGEDDAAPVSGAVPVIDDGAQAAGEPTPVPPVLDPSLPPADALRAVPLFAGLPDDARLRIGERATTVRVKAGEWLLRQGEEADCLFVICSGRLDVLLESDGEELLRTLGPGDVLGELAVVAESVRSASVRARRDSRLIRVAAADFTALHREMPDFALAVSRELGRQLQASRIVRPSAQPLSATLAVVPLEEGLPMAELARELARALGRFGPAVLLAGDGTKTDAEHADRLERLEREHEHVLLASEVPDGDDAWTNFCLRQADRVLAVTRGGPVHPWLGNRRALHGCDLVFLDEGSGAEAIGAWARALEPRSRHRLEEGAGFVAGVEMAARRLAGRSVGVVLSGGGARGFAHIGALDELIRAGVVIDRVGGVSCGSWIGGMFGLGMDPDEIDARCYEEWVRRNPLTDYTLPRESIIRGERVRAVFERNLPGLIEEMPRDYFCLSVDLVTGEEVIHRDGPLAVAAAASQCLPALAPPVAWRGRLLIDGGVRNNLPVREMAETGEGPVIAVDVTSRYEGPAGGRRRRRHSQAQVGIWDDSSPRPGLGETLTRAIVLGSIDTAEAARKYADLVITPENEDIGMLEWHQLDRVRERGRRAAAAALEHAPARLFA